MTVLIDRNSGVIDAIAMKMPVAVVTSTNVALSGLIIVGGYQLIAGDRVLVNGQTDATQNGIYVAATNAWSRSQDFNSGRNITPGSRFIVLNPFLSPPTEYILSTATPEPIVIGVTEFVFTSVSRSEFSSVSVATGSIISSYITRIHTLFYAPNFLSPATLVGGAWYRASDASEVALYPALAWFTSADGRYWLLDEDEPWVEMFGALPDNTTNATPAWNAGVDYIVASTCGVLRASGKYHFGASVNIKNDLSIRGSSWESTQVKTAGNYPAFRYNGSASVQLRRFSIRDILIRGSFVHNKAAFENLGTKEATRTQYGIDWGDNYGIQIRWASHPIIERVQFRSCFACIGGTNMVGLTMRNCIHDGNFGTGIDVSYMGLYLENIPDRPASGSGYDSTQHISDCQFQSIAHTAWRIKGTAGMKISNCSGLTGEYGWYFGDPDPAGTLTNPFTTTNASAVVTVTIAAHDLSNGEKISFSGATAVGGITINNDYVIAGVTTNTFTITHVTAATSSATGGGTAVKYYTARRIVFIHGNGLYADTHSDRGFKFSRGNSPHKISLVKITNGWAGSILSGTSGAGVAIDGMEDGSFVGWKMSNVDENAIRITNSEDVDFTDFGVEEYNNEAGGHDAFFVGSCTRIQFTGCSAYPAVGISTSYARFEDCTDCNVTGGMSVNSGGVELHNTTYTTVIGLRVPGAIAGVTETGTSDLNTIVGNNFNTPPVIIGASTVSGLNGGTTNPRIGLVGGSVTAPAMYWRNAPNSGWYRMGSYGTRYSVNGVVKFGVHDDGRVMVGTKTATGDVAINGFIDSIDQATGLSVKLATVA